MYTMRKQHVWLLILLLVAMDQLQAAPHPMTWREHREAAEAQSRYHLADPVPPVQHLERALELARNAGASPADIGDLMDRLAWEYRIEERKNGEEEALLQETLRYKRQTLGEYAPELVPTLMLLNGLRFNQQRYLEAFQVLAEAITIQRRNFGPESAEVAQSYTYLGLSYEAVGDKEQAELYLRRSVEILRKVANPPDETFSGALTSLAALLRQTGRADEAKALAAEAVPALKRAEEKGREEARAYEHLPRKPVSGSDVLVLSPEETAAALAAAQAALEQMELPPR